jgi:hypothetical protein
MSTAEARRPYLTHQQKFLRHTVLPLTALLAAGTLTNVATDGGVTRLGRSAAIGVHLVDNNFGEPLDPSRTFDVTLSPFPSQLDDPRSPYDEAALYNRIVPRVKPTTDSSGSKINTQDFYNALAGNNSATLVYGGNYPSGIEDPGLLGDLRKERVAKQQKAWESVLKQYGIGETYWNFQKDLQRRGLWLRFDLAKPLIINGKEVHQAFVSLHQGIPIEPLSQASQSSLKEQAKTVFSLAASPNATPPNRAARRANK